MGFDGEPKVIGRVGDPVWTVVSFTSLPEVYYLHGVQLRRVEVQEFLLRELLG